MPTSLSYNPLCTALHYTTLHYHTDTPREGRKEGDSALVADVPRSTRHNNSLPQALQGTAYSLYMHHAVHLHSYNMYMHTAYVHMYIYYHTHTIQYTQYTQYTHHTHTNQVGSTTMRNVLLRDQLRNPQHDFKGGILRDYTRCVCVCVIVVECACVYVRM
jgi:hypothetical protein